MKKHELEAMLAGQSEIVLESPNAFESGIYDGEGKTVILPLGLSIMADDVTLKNFNFIGPVVINGARVTLCNCTVKASGVAILSCGSEFIARGNTVTGADTSFALEGGSYNCLVAENVCDGKISLRDSFNCAVILNTASAIWATECVNFYAIANTVSSSIIASDCDYVICDDNVCPEACVDGCRDYNGNNVTDVEARAEVGALPCNLPHTNKDLFVGMERKSLVRDSEYGDSLSLDKYLSVASADHDTVIVPPGAYTVSNVAIINEPCVNTKIYAYGAYLELDRYDPVLSLDGTHDVEVRGLTLGHAPQSCGQAHVLEQLSDNEFIIVPSAGSVDDFASTNTEIFSSAVELVPQSGLYTTFFVGPNKIVKNDDGTMTFTIGGNELPGRIHVGDMLICRIGGHNKFSLRVNNARNILFRDFVLYGYAAALAVVGSGPSENVRFERMHNTVHSGPIIDRKTYNRYRCLEAKYGVDLNISTDGFGRMRGCPSMIGSVDAMHVVGTRKGYDVISSILEQMTDDGCNQRSASSRLGGIRDNGDGTTTIIYKGTVAEVYFKMGAGCGSCVDFVKGDRIFIYNSKGQRLCDTHVLDDAEDLGTIEFSITAFDRTRDFKTKLHAVKVPTADVNFAAVEGYDLEDNHCSMDHKILVDNLSRNSVGFVYDNVIVRNTRSRGILFKTMNGTAKNCTFKNLGHTGCLLSVESVWGESTVGSGTVISKCIIDHVGFINNYSFYTPLCPVSIVGFSSTVSEDTLLYKDILIEGNRFKNNTHDYFININSAENVRIINNTFEVGALENRERTQKVFNIESAMNIEISGNKYSQFLKNVRDGIDAKNFKNIYGTDIQLEGDV